MSSTNANNQIASELAARLESHFGKCTFLLKYAREAWLHVADQHSSPNVPQSLLNTLSKLDFRSTDPLVDHQDGQLLVVINPCLDALVPMVVAMVLPDQDERMVCSLATAHLEALQYRDEAIAARKQSEFFIDQVTQDFEELTWLRTANEYFDLCGSKHSIESIARKCLPDLSRVIGAENIVFVPVVDCDTYSIARPDWDQAIATNPSNFDQESSNRFLEESIPYLSNGPRVQNNKLICDFPRSHSGIRNGIAIAVAKAARTYGWILAINKTPSQNGSAQMEAEAAHPSATQFGTFEASLLSAASNIMSSHARNLELFTEQESLLTGIVRAIINAIDAKDPYTCGHSDRVAHYAKRIAARFGQSVEECERIYMAGLLHDVGKIGVPDSILGKPGALTSEEYAIVKKHPEIGHTILKHLKQLDYVLPGVLHHHEAVNGSGYPMGLVGEAIPLHGRILAVADAYDAMTSDRPYRPGMPSEKAESILKAEAGKVWDSEIVAVFLDCLINDEIQPHTTDSASNSVAKDLSPNANDSLMRRIASSINSMVGEQ